MLIIWRKLMKDLINCMSWMMTFKMEIMSLCIKINKWLAAINKVYLIIMTQML